MVRTSAFGAGLTYGFDVSRAWRRVRLLLERSEIFVPALILVVLVLVLLLSRVLTAERIFTPQTGPVVTPMPTVRTPSPLTGPAPNIVLILTDDQRATDVSVMPNVKRLLSDRGITFTRAYASTALCCPSRASILTGQHPYHTGVFDNFEPGGGVSAFKDRSTVSTWLNEAGYTTSYVGKYLNGYEQLGGNSFVPPGWDDWHASLTLEPSLGPASGYYDFGLNENGDFNTFGSSPENYVTTVLSRRAVDFVSKAPSPFFLHFAPNAPHIPAMPAPGDANAFADRPPERPPSYNHQADDRSPAANLEPLTERLENEMDNYLRNALASLLGVDRAVADIHDAVDARGELDNTVFIFMSDNGMLLGEHRILGKAWPYEPSIHLPLIIKMPGSDEASVSDELVQNVDIAPTITELAGARPRLRFDGVSLVPLLRGEPVKWRQEIPIMYLGDGRYLAPPRFIAIRTSRYKFILYQTGDRELFDLENDPHELENLSGTPDAYEIEEPLFQRLARLTPQGYLGRRSLPRPTPYPSVPSEEFFAD
jgi:N-acetylglucosamine-6-sulfatase